VSAPIPPDETDRLKALKGFEILDTKQEQEFDDIAQLASQICGAPIALISLIDENRQWFKSNIGLTVTETSRDSAFCAHGILQREVFVIEDALADKRFADNPLVTGTSQIRFYAGAPLLTADGHALGMLCVNDKVPRELSADQKSALQALSRQVVALLELRSSLAQIRRQDKTLQLLSSAVIQSKEAIVITDAEIDLPGPTIVFVNPAFTKMSGFTAEEAIGKTPRILQGPRTDKGVMARLRQKLLSGEIFEGEAVNYRKNGEAFDVEWQISSVCDPAGTRTHFIAIQRDITERKRLEKRFRRLVDSNVQAVFFWNSKGEITESNDAYLKLVRCTREDLADGLINWASMTPPEYAQLDRIALEEIAADGACTPYEKQLIRKDGTRLPVLFGATAFEDSRDEGVAFILDLSDRKEAERKIRLNEGRYRSLVEATTEIVWQTPASGEFIVEQPQWTSFTGQSFDELRGWGWLNAIHVEDRQKTERVWTRALADRAPYKVEHRLRAQDGTYHDMMVRAVPLLDDRGNVDEWIGIHTDVTERKKLEEQLFQSQKMETVGKLAGGVAHEFNSILTAIIGQSELMLIDLKSDSPMAKSATEINKAATRAAGLTRQLLAYGRKQILNTENLDLNAVVSGLENTLRHLMGFQTDVRFIPAPGLKLVTADAGQIEQVIMNMALNARDAMPHGGKLTLETANISFSEERAGNYPELKPGGYVMLAISDTGMGMDAEVKRRVFEPFFSTKEVGQGTGLGLSTCYGIVKQSGGHINVYGEPARGAVFKIYLPEAPSVVTPHLVHLNSPNLPRGNETILLAEDDPSLLEMSATLLRRLGYTVLTAPDGIEALNLKQNRATGHVDLLLTDVVMPHMSGNELANRIRSIYPRTKILFTSAYTENSIVHQGTLNAGIALLQKPFTPTTLAQRVRTVLDEPLP
jgi:PAS domain S-box-containing protein